MKRYFPKTVAAWNTALVELQRWNNSRALVCDHGCIFRRRRIRADLAAFKGAMHEQDYPGHVVKVRRFG